MSWHFLPVINFHIEERGKWYRNKIKINHLLPFVKFNAFKPFYRPIRSTREGNVFRAHPQPPWWRLGRSLPPPEKKTFPLTSNFAQNGPNDVFTLIKPRQRLRLMKLDIQPNGIGRCLGLCAVCTVLHRPAIVRSHWPRSLVEFSVSFCVNAS